MNDLYTIVKNARDDRLKPHYKRYCMILMRVIKEAKERYYQKFVSTSENKIQLTWRIINKESGNKQSTDNITELQMGESKLTNAKEVAEESNKYFIIVTENLEMKNDNKNEAITLLDTLKYGNLRELRPIPATEAEIKNILMSETKKFYKV
jgi:hypothetical protein